MARIRFILNAVRLLRMWFAAWTDRKFSLPLPVRRIPQLASPRSISEWRVIQDQSETEEQRVGNRATVNAIRHIIPFPRNASDGTPSIGTQSDPRALKDGLR